MIQQNQYRLIMLVQIESVKSVVTEYLQLTYATISDLMTAFNSINA